MKIIPTKNEIRSAARGKQWRQNGDGEMRGLPMSKAGRLKSIRCRILSAQQEARDHGFVIGEDGLPVMPEVDDDSDVSE